ncbi:metallophosphoesterase family protein [Hymenobacter humi]|uniref:Metallophosphoesterase family protein n=1 Tax=Hymenobacter humi TaxID=1411620 RepID=A0ABW2U6V0_9BACT
MATDSARAYFDYFDLPGNERYYDFARGQVHFFVLNSHPSEPDGITVLSRQAQWLRERLAAAPEPWKVVYFHHAPYSSGEHGSTLLLRWPFQDWGASLVLAGHDHHYERLVRGDLVYCVNGLGGRSQYNMSIAPIAGSKFRYNADYGAQLLEAGADSLSLRFYARTGQARRRLHAAQGPEPAAHAVRRVPNPRARNSARGILGAPPHGRAGWWCWT